MVSGILSVFRLHGVEFSADNVLIFLHTVFRGGGAKKQSCFAFSERKCFLYRPNGNHFPFVCDVSFTNENNFFVKRLKDL